MNAQTITKRSAFCDDTKITNWQKNKRWHKNKNTAKQKVMTQK
jgi:hypothetical protein